jgi:hypothetical protein
MRIGFGFNVDGECIGTCHPYDKKIIKRNYIIDTKKLMYYLAVQQSAAENDRTSLNIMS